MSSLRPTLREHTAEAIVSFIRQKLEESGAKGIVVGMSGGVDSSVVAVLCVRALGPKRVLGLILPSADSDPEDRKDALAMARQLGIQTQEISIASFVAAFEAELDATSDRVLLANIKARCRMIALYHVARREQLIVIGTSNKSEYALGYFTKWGDGGADFAPLGDLYKTQVRALAKELEIPAKICEKVPTAGLWPGQTDEGELGITYDRLDQILHGIEFGLDAAEIRRRTGFSVREIARVMGLVRATVHKRKMPLIPKLGVRTFGLDWRE